MNDGPRSKPFLAKTKRVVFFVILNALTLNVGAQITGDFKGSFTLVFFPNGVAHTNSYSVDLQSQPPFWHLILLSTNTHRETFAGSNRVEIVSYNDNVAPTTNGHGLNTATIKIFPGDRPLSARIEEHIWAALFSHDTFADKHPPFTDIGLCIDEPCIFTELEINERDVSPQSARWHNKHADTYSHQSRIEGSFKWLSASKLLATHRVPLSSGLTVVIRDTNGVTRLASYSELTIDQIAPLAAALQMAPTIQGRAPVYDYRFVEDKFGKPHITYESFNGVIPPKNSSTIQNTRAALSVNKQTDSKRPRYGVLIMFVVVTAGLAFFALRSKENQMNKL